MEETLVKEARATLKFARISSRKVKIVADLIRGKDVDEALAIMKFTPKASSEVLEKLLKSAIANAENNNGMSVENLYVEECYANKGRCHERSRQQTGYQNLVTPFYNLSTVRRTYNCCS